MKKTFVTIAALLLVAFSSATVSAQTKLVHFGVKAGANFSTLDYTDYGKNVGYQAGIAMQFNLPMWFSVEPDILFHIRGAKDDQYDYSQGLGYIEMPVNIQWGPSFLDDNLRVFLSAGPYIGYAVSKDIKGLETVQPDGSKTREVFSWDNINRFEYGAAVGLGIKIFAFQISAEYSWNFGQLRKPSAVKGFPDIFNNNNFSGINVNVAIIF